MGKALSYLNTEHAEAIAHMMFRGDREPVVAWTMGDIPNVKVYVVYIAMCSTTMSEHITHIKRVFDRLRQAGLKVKYSKCQIAKERIHMLGFFVRGDKLMMDQGKVSANTEASRPALKTGEGRF